MGLSFIETHLYAKYWVALNNTRILRLGALGDKARMDEINMTDPNTPWLAFYGNIPKSIDYPDRSLYQIVADAAEKNLDGIAYEFEGRETTFKKMMKRIGRAASCLRVLGVGKGDRVLICLPNTPQAITMFYAVNSIGAVSAMIHPLSSKNEIEDYLISSRAKVAVTLDQFFPNFPEIAEIPTLECIVVTGIKDGLSKGKGTMYELLYNRKTPKVTTGYGIYTWKGFKALSKCTDVPHLECPQDAEACILYTGGTTGKSKGAVLSNRNMNATAIQTMSMSEIDGTGKAMLSVMPMFHGFGLCIGIHMVLLHGMKCILVPRLTPEIYAHMIYKKRPNFIAGVPTLFELMIRNKLLVAADLSCLEGVFSGGDTLTAELKTNVDNFLKKHNSSTTIREGYGTTECVTASCLTPLETEWQKSGSIGIPMPDTLYKIVTPGTEDVLDWGQDGEICIAGPSVMLRYDNEEQETADTLKVHSDGRIWLHTGDEGMMDKDGFVFFKQRIKRIIISSGYNIYPSQIESSVNKLPFVDKSCAVGMPDPIKAQVVKLYIVLKGDTAKDDLTKKKILEHCSKNVAKYAIPKKIVFIDEMPVTKVGKIAYTELEKRTND